MHSQEMMIDVLEMARTLRKFVTRGTHGVDADYLSELARAGLVRLEGKLTQEGREALALCEEIEILCDLGFLTAEHGADGSITYRVL